MRSWIFGNQRIGIRGDHREGANPLARCRILPVLPEPADAERVAIQTLHVVLLPSFITNALGLEFGLGKGAACKHVDRDLDLAACSYLGRDAAGRRVWVLHVSVEDLQPLAPRSCRARAVVRHAFPLCRLCRFLPIR